MRDVVGCCCIAAFNLAKTRRDVMLYSATTRHFPHSRGVNSASLGTSAVMAVALLAQ
jgi:hypothetical protein